MTDLIDECGKDLSLMGYECQKEDKFGIEFCFLNVDSKQKAKEMGFDIGKYYIVNCPMLAKGKTSCFEFVEKYVSKAIKNIIKEYSISKQSRFLIVGLGNPQILADSLGTKTIDMLDIDVFKKNNNIFKFAPNIFANTGINALETVGMLSVWLNIDCVIIVDSLATSCIDRISASIQINSAGITPGSAVNCNGKKLCHDSLGVPCVSIGVPFMFYGDVLGKKDMLLSPKDIHEDVRNLAYILSNAIKHAIF